MSDFESNGGTSAGGTVFGGGAQSAGGLDSVGGSVGAGGATHYGGSSTGGESSSQGGFAGASVGGQVSASGGWTTNGGSSGAGSNSQGGSINTQTVTGGSGAANGGSAAASGGSGASGGSAATSSVVGGSANGGSGVAGSAFGGSSVGGSAIGGTTQSSALLGGTGPVSTISSGGAATGGVATGGATAASGGAASGGIGTASGGAVAGGGTCNWTSGPPAFGKAKSLGAPNTSAWEADPVLSYDGLSLYFARFNQGNYDIYVATRSSVTRSFDAGTLLTAANSSSDEAHFFVSVSGLEAFVVSRRSGTADIFRATRTSTTAPWGTFSALDGLDASSDEQDPHLDADQLTLWFAPAGRTDGTGVQDIFYATRPDPTSSFGAPVEATVLNSTAQESDISLTQDGLVIVFLSTRSSTRRIYYAVRATRAQSFGSPLPLTALDSYSDSSLGNPFVAPNGCAVYFTADVPSGKGGGDIYAMEASP